MEKILRNLGAFTSPAFGGDFFWGGDPGFEENVGKSYHKYGSYGN